MIIWKAQIKQNKDKKKRKIKMERKTKRYAAVLLAAAMTLTACGNDAEKDKIPALPAVADGAFDEIKETDGTVFSANEAPEPDKKPAETWVEADSNAQPPADGEPAFTEDTAQTEETTAAETKPVSDGEITAIELTYYEITLTEGEEDMPIVTMYPEDAEDKSEIWTSSDESVATVNWKGNITAQSEGECIIRVQSEVCPEVYAEVKVKVITADEYESREIQKIELTYYETTMDIGEEDMPIVTMYPEDAEDKSEIWTSSDESVATVDRKGRIIAHKAGKCIIRVQSAVCPEVFAEVRVTVRSNGEEVYETQAAVTEAPVSETAAEEKPASDSAQGLTYVDGILIANKTYALPSDYNPGVDSEAKEAFDRMQADAADEGLNIYISSGFRSYAYQEMLYERYVEKSGKAEADRYSARPGHSEHQTGLAFDLNTIDISFADTQEYVWVKEHCAEYGFIIRYPENKESITGYMYEPWHLRYLGKETAQKVADSGLTLEEYLGIDSVYKE